MGQRSQIYIRYTKNLETGEKGLIANYYQWNYGERMISRARHGIQYLKNTFESLFCDPKFIIKLSRIFDTNFDMKDVAISCDIINEWKTEFPNENFNEYVFLMQDNNDGKLLVDCINTHNIKYAFLDYDANPDKIMNAAQYMDWNMGDWRNDETIPKKAKLTCERNIKWITKNATLMTKEEVKDFINYEYKV